MTNGVKSSWIKSSVNESTYPLIVNETLASKVWANLKNKLSPRILEVYSKTIKDRLAADRKTDGQEMT